MEKLRSGNNSRGWRESEEKGVVWCQRENEAEGAKDKTTAQRRYIYTEEGRTKSALVKIQGRRWREAIITIHQDNK